MLSNLTVFSTPPLATALGAVRVLLGLCTEIPNPPLAATDLRLVLPREQGVVGHLPQIRDEMLQQHAREGPDLPARIVCISAGGGPGKALREGNREASLGPEVAKGRLGSPPYCVVGGQCRRKYVIHPWVQWAFCFWGC